MKTLPFLAAMAVAFATAPQASAIEVLHAGASATGPSRHTAPPSIFAAPVLPAAEASELPEPEVVAMMLVGLVLIGYRASRDSDEKFK